MSSDGVSRNPPSISRVYANVNINSPPEYSNYDEFEIDWGSSDNYEIVSKAGRGKYSDVFHAIDIRDNSECVIKVLKPVRSGKIRREIKILGNLAGGPNIIRLFDVVRNEESKTTSLILESVNNVNFKQLYPTLGDMDIRNYLFKLLRALDYSHSRGIMHRDVKPNNVMIDPHTKKLRLVDWGLAEFYHPGFNYNVRVASRYFKGPELLVDFGFYDYSLDIWGFGCMFAGMIFRKEPFFLGQDNTDQLVKIVKVLGTDDFELYLKKYKIKLDRDLAKHIGKHPKRGWDKYINASNASLVNPESIDLLNRVLCYDHQQRLTASEVMNHSYFDPIRRSLQ